jgi:hypothetical protein
MSLDMILSDSVRSFGSQVPKVGGDVTVMRIGGCKGTVVPTPPPPESPLRRRSYMHMPNRAGYPSCSDTTRR